MKRLGFQVSVLIVVVLAAGCAMQQKQVEQQLANPAAINCATAEGDIRLLQQEKANVAQRIVEGATAIYPAGLVRHRPGKEGGDRVG